MTALLRSLPLMLALLFPAMASADGGTCACGMSNDACQQTGCTCPASTCPVHAGHARHRGMGPGPMAMPSFDAKTVQTVRGTVVGVDRVEHRPGMVGVHLRVKVGTETLVVHAGPGSFIDPKMQFAVNDAIEATGSRLTFNAEPTLLATTITRGGKTVAIREADGTPLFRMPMMTGQ